MSPMKNCAVCGRFFRPYRGTSLYCSSQCKDRSRRSGWNAKRLCATCGESFKAGQHNALYCSARCRGRREHQRKRYVLSCVGCDKTFRSSNGQQRYCSLACARANPNARDGACLRCGKSFVAHRKTHKGYCSYYCRAAQSQGRVLIARLASRPCEACGSSFKPHTHNQRFCSSLCAKNIERQQQKYRYDLAHPERIGKCIGCQKPFKINRLDQKFCSRICSSRTYRDLYRDELSTKAALRRTLNRDLLNQRSREHKRMRTLENPHYSRDKERQRKRNILKRENAA